MVCQGEVDGSMDSKRAALLLLLLLLLLDWGHTREPGSRDGVFAVRRRWGTPPSTVYPDSWVPLAFSAPGHGETWQEPSLPISSPKVWQKCLGVLEQRAAKSPG
ncbi:uncharacterized protein LOC143269828 isoform X2 [Peromyscus maniculatus bairdii]|uniref:uncharacterized protein LOC143269828 isoform X2 n=1 Tax=Peromyscus maniculatus bairdii TaxID=230844 RepID=UPI003FD369DC